MNFFTNALLALALLAGTSAAATSPSKVYVTYLSSAKGKIVEYETTKVDDGAAVMAYVGTDTHARQVALADLPRELLAPIKKSLPRFAKLNAAFVTIAPASN